MSARLQCEEVTAGPDGNIVSHIFIQGADDFVLGAAAEDGAAGAVAGGQQGWDTGPSPTSVSPGMTDYPGRLDARLAQTNNFIILCFQVIFSSTPPSLSCSQGRRIRTGTILLTSANCLST